MRIMTPLVITLLLLGGAVGVAQTPSATSEAVPAPPPGGLTDATLKQMLETDKKAEEEAISMYRKILLLSRKEGDSTTEFLFNRILSDEEEHHDLFTSLLEKD